MRSRAATVLAVLALAGCMAEERVPEEPVPSPNMNPVFEALDCQSVGALWNVEPVVLAARLPPELTSRSDQVFSFTVACDHFIVDGADGGSGAMHIVGTEVEPVAVGGADDEHAFLFDQIFRDESAARWWQTTGFPATMGAAASQVAVDGTAGTMQASSANGSIELVVASPPGGPLSFNADRAVHLYAADGRVLSGDAEEFVYGSLIGAARFTGEPWQVRLGADETADVAWIAQPVSFWFDREGAWK